MEASLFVDLPSAPSFSRVCSHIPITCSSSSISALHSSALSFTPPSFLYPPVHSSPFLYLSPFLYPTPHSFLYSTPFPFLYSPPFHNSIPPHSSISSPLLYPLSTLLSHLHSYHPSIPLSTALFSPSLPPSSHSSLSVSLPPSLFSYPLSPFLTSLPSLLFAMLTAFLISLFTSLYPLPSLILTSVPSLLYTLTSIIVSCKFSLSTSSRTMSPLPSPFPINLSPSCCPTP